MSPSIGHVTWPRGSPVAVLHTDGTWTANAPGLPEELAAIYADHYQGPSAGFYGVAILDDLATLVGGLATIRDGEVPDDPEIMY